VNALVWRSISGAFVGPPRLHPMTLCLSTVATARPPALNCVSYMGSAQELVQFMIIAVSVGHVKQMVFKRHGMMDSHRQLSRRIRLDGGLQQLPPVQIVIQHLQ